MGVDPGLTRCGVGVIEGSPGRPIKLIAAGVITTSPSAPHEQRLLAIEKGLAQWFDTHTPERVAVERVYADQNVLSVMGTAQAAGLAMIAAAKRGLPVAMHTPTEVKAAITGSGRADKSQIGAMVAKILKLAEPPKPADAADAVALAICHLWRGAAADRIEQALSKAQAKEAK
ncbi:MAG: crossover junction endodeoxyribonuclease RuvC [Propionibacteriaceae bacterium]|nr:crossover junction endodeoxyribonuclease RuvC [Propionibacteriaceae bacterium]